MNQAHPFRGPRLYHNCAPPFTAAKGWLKIGIALPPGAPNWSAAAARWEKRTLATKKKILGATPRRWLEYLIAILFGNAIYYFSLYPHLPQSLQHQGFQMDLGVLIDFVVCVAIYGLIRLGSSL